MLRSSFRPFSFEVAFVRTLHLEGNIRSGRCKVYLRNILTMFGPVTSAGAFGSLSDRQGEVR